MARLQLVVPVAFEPHRLRAAAGTREPAAARPRSGNSPAARGARDRDLDARDRGGAAGVGRAAAQASAGRGSRRRAAARRSAACGRCTCRRTGLRAPAPAPGGEPGRRRAGSRSRRAARPLGAGRHLQVAEAERRVGRDPQPRDGRGRARHGRREHLHAGAAHRGHRDAARERGVGAGERDVDGRPACRRAGLAPISRAIGGDAGRDEERPGHRLARELAAGLHPHVAEADRRARARRSRSRPPTSATGGQAVHGHTGAEARDAAAGEVREAARDRHVARLTGRDRRGHHRQHGRGRRRADHLHGADPARRLGRAVAAAAW